MIYSSAPPLRPFSEKKPTLLVSWWITIFCTCIILLRLAGRYIRVEKLFREDRIVAGALLPLFLRMGCAHMVLLWGTNNADFSNHDLSDNALNNHANGSRVVLAGRIFYAATLWMLKFTTLEFLNRLAGASMKKIYLRLTMFLRYALGASFIAVIVSDLAECQPVAKYWQVIPDPGAQCRQGFVQLLTMGTTSAIIDIILIVFPVPIILSTRIPTKRKVLLVMLFCFGFLTVGITLYRMPKIVNEHGDQVVRSMWASIELLAATTVANIVALGSFLRDSGAKKTKFRPGYQQSSGTTSRGGQGPLTGSNWDDAEHSKQHRKTESDEWLDQIAPHTSREPIRKLEDRNSSRSSAVRGHSPTESDDSLIGPQRTYSRCTDTIDLSQPKTPSRAVVAGSGFQRR